MTAEPQVRQFRPEHNRPTPHTARSLFAQPGDVITWSGGIHWRWDGEQFHQLQPGDVCRNARDGSAILWTGNDWQPPHVSNMDVDELARTIDPEAFPDTAQLSRNIDHGDDYWQTRQHLAKEAAQRTLAAGYVMAYRRPAVAPASYHVTRLDYQAGDLVDITWTNGRTTHHVVDHLDGNGGPVLRTLALIHDIQP